MNWLEIELDVADYLFFIGRENWRETFVPLIQAVIVEQDGSWRDLLALGVQFDVRNLFAEAWFDQYVLQFAQPITATTKRELGVMLQQASREGWGIDETANRLDLMFQQWMTGDLTPEQFAWYENRLPPYRRQMIARTETIRASNAGSWGLFGAWGVRYKEWLNAGDHRVRPTHVIAGGAYQQGGTIGPIPINQPFIVGGAALMFPGDPSAPAEETIQCRCTILPFLPPAA